ncbi:hypothetical protein VKT23_018820 [Stygiomarasmius scandens]|uniref:Uncharacterized protein n=1 Tax=Marasmiellus scandens TaxID=2682957 RepID=A0ABR1IN01_9AGAR
MESQRRARLMLRIPTQNSRLLRAHHPYKRDLCIPSSHANWPSLNQHVHGADVDRFLEAVVLLPPLNLRQQEVVDVNENENENENIAIEPEDEFEGRQAGGIMELLDVLVTLGLLILILASRISGL